MSTKNELESGEIDMRRQLALLLWLLFAAGSANAQYFTINGMSSSFTLSGCQDLQFYATGSVSTIGYSKVKWELIQDGAVVETKNQQFYGVFNSITSITFTRPAQAGSYTVLKTNLGNTQSFPVITVSLANPSVNKCPIGGYDGANCHLMPKPSTGFIWNNAFYVQSQKTTTCPKGWYDGANCYIMPKPAGGFIYGNSFYIAKKSAPCPATYNGYPVWFDGANCHVLAAPWGTKPFEWRGNWYTTPLASCSLGAFDGANCFIVSAPPGTKAFEWRGNWYTSPKLCG